MLCRWECSSCDDPESVDLDLDLDPEHYERPKMVANCSTEYLEMVDRRWECWKLRSRGMVLPHMIPPTGINTC